ncbi:MAG TPA: alpha/beta fold hydrolase, partial [Pirellulaceae bacterium]
MPMLRHVDTAAGSIAYLDEGSGPLLLLVHGFPLDRTMWREQMELADSYRLLIPDLPGFGQSPSNRSVSHMVDFADDLAVLLDALGIDGSVVFCGLSMGGYVAWEFFARHRHRVSALILADTRAANDTPEVARARELMAERVLAEGVEPLVASMLPKLFGRHATEVFPDRVAATRAV